MDRVDDSDLTFTADGSRLLSESSLMASESNSSHQGSTHNELSLSDLSIQDFNKPFSLLSRPEPTTPPQQVTVLEDVDEAEGGGRDEGIESLGPETAKRRDTRAREEKLQGDIFVLRKLNSSFAAFNEALDAAGGVTDRIAKQLAQTDALLNKYVEILYKSEEVARLIFDDDWKGGEADEEQLERERREAIDRALREEEERRLTLERERERLEREERERHEKELQERLEQEKRERLAARGRARGVSRRGTTVRGTARGTTAPRSSISGSASRIRPPGSGLPTQRTSGATTGGRTPPSAAARGARKP